MEYSKDGIKPMSDEELDEVSGGRRAGANFSMPGQATRGKAVGARGKGALARGKAVGGRGKAVGARGKGVRGEADR